MSMFNEYNTSILSYFVIGNLPFIEVDYPNHVDGLGINECCWDYSETPFDPSNIKTDYIRNARKLFNPDLQPWIQSIDFVDFFESGDPPSITICAPIFDYANTSDSIGSACLDYNSADFFDYFDFSQPTENGYFIVVDSNGIVSKASEEALALLYGATNATDRYQPIYKTESPFRGIYDGCLKGSTQEYMTVGGKKYLVEYSPLMFKNFYILGIVLYEDITTSNRPRHSRCSVGVFV